MFVISLPSRVQSDAVMGGVVLVQHSRCQVLSKTRYDTIEEFNVDSKAEYSNSLI